MGSLTKIGQNGAGATLEYLESESQTYTEDPEKEPSNPDKDTPLTKNVSLESFKYPISIKEFMEKIKEDLEKSFENSTRENYRKSLDELKEITGHSKDTIERVTEKYAKIFCMDTRDRVTTRELYKKYTPLIAKIASFFDGRVI